jgi:hypothetical protein
MTSPIVTGNWQFGTTSSTGSAPLMIGGSIANPSGSSLTAAVHVGGSPCFDSSGTVLLTGTLSGNGVALTSSAIAGQVITFTGSVSGVEFSGTYSITGGCASGDRGQLGGHRVPSISDVMAFTFTSSSKETFSATGQLLEAPPTAEGVFPLTGAPFVFSGSCFHSGAVQAGAYPQGSFVIGTSVALRIETDNGMLVFHGVVDPTSRIIVGDYTVNGGTCIQNGTAVLAGAGVGAWDY